MKTRRIGSLDVSVIGLGANNFGTDFFGTSCDLETSTRVIHAALDAGVNLIDTAEEYSTTTHIGSGRSEEFIGLALGRRRNDVIIATKFSPKVQDAPDQKGAERIVAAVEGSLKRLGTDRIDLYQQHFPAPGVPIDEILEAMTRLVRDGKVREIGCSNFTADMIDEAQGVSASRDLARFASLQTPYNMLDNDAAKQSALDACGRHDMMLLPCFPLASGLLTGKYKANQPAPADSRFGVETKVIGYLRDQLSDDRVAKAQALEAYARERGHSLLALAMSWLASQPRVASVIAGATRPEQVLANAEAASWDLTEDDFKAVARLTDSPQPAPN
jgi:aryl-alcohol dehydrogenase-like predicted oxidoreductase